MEALGVLRTVVIFCLVTTFRSPAVNATQPSTFTKPSTLKDTLDFLEKLGSFNKKSAVAKRIVEVVDQKIQTYLETNESWRKGVQKNLDIFFRDIHKLRRVFLRSPTQYGNYQRLKDVDINASVDALITWLPVIQSDLWFLYYQTTRDAAAYGGGTWSDHRFSKAHRTTRIHKWLTDTFERKPQPYIQKGFKPDDLHLTSLGRHIASLMGLFLHKGGLLDYTQYGLLFLTDTWHDSNLGCAVLFLQEFCQEVHEGRFDKYIPNEKYGPLKSACEGVSADFGLLTDIIDPLHQVSIGGNKDNLEDKYLPKYIEWFKENLQNVIASFSRMATDSSDWTVSSLSSATSIGPFKYGFAFKDGKWEVPIKSELPITIKSLVASVSAGSGSIGTLKKLQASIRGLQISGSAQSSGDL